MRATYGHPVALAAKTLLRYLLAHSFCKDKRRTESRVTLPLIKTFYGYLKSGFGQFLLQDQRQAGKQENVRMGSDETASCISLFDLHQSVHNSFLQAL